MARICELGVCFDVNKTSIFTNYISSLFTKSLVSKGNIKLSDEISDIQIFLLLEKFKKTLFDFGEPVILCTLGGSSSSFVVAQSSTIARVSQTSSS